MILFCAVQGFDFTTDSLFVLLREPYVAICEDNKSALISIEEKSEITEVDMMAAEDLTQMKWCHIRAVENCQGVELENINLRRIITSEPTSFL